MIRRLPILAILGLITTAVRAEDAPTDGKPISPPGASPPATAPSPPPRPAPSPTAERAADAALTAWNAKDAAALRALAEQDEPDPWLVADELIARNAYDAAEAFAKAAPRKDVERLPAYVQSRRGEPDDAVARRSAAAAYVALTANRPRDALSVLGPLATEAPQDVVGVRREFFRGRALAAVGRWEESAACFGVVADAAQRMGWIVRVTRALHEAGTSAYRRSDYREALSAWERLRVVVEARGDRANVAATLVNIGAVHYGLGSYPKALECYEQALRLREELGNRAAVGTTLSNIGMVHRSLGNYPKAMECFERALEISEETGNRAGSVPTLVSIGSLHCALGSYPKALECEGRALQLAEELGDRQSAADALANLGSVHRSLGSYAEALGFFERSLKTREELGDRAAVVESSVSIGSVHKLLGNYAKALELYERALKTSEALGNRTGVALALVSIGNVHDSLGSYPKALEHYGRALKINEELGKRASVALTLGSIGNVHWALGDYPKALEHNERALRMKESLGDRAGAAMTLGNLGVVHYSLGNCTKALELQERALKLQEALGDRASAALTLSNLGLVCCTLGDHPKALEHLERALKMMEDLGDRHGAAVTLGSIGLVQYRLGNHLKALEYFERDLKLAGELGNRTSVAAVLGNLGDVHASLGNYPKALEHQESSLALAIALGARTVDLRARCGLARAHLARGDGAQAMVRAREGVAGLSLLASGLSEEQGTGVRERFSEVYGIGAGAAAALDAAGDLSYFLESGRAGALLESLKGRDALRGAALPEALRIAEAEAREKEALAVTAYRKALDGEDRARIRALRLEMERAQEGIREVVERIQREAKAAASVLYPKADTLAEIQKRLGPGESFVSYGLFPEEPMALVVTARETRIVRLPPVKAIESAVEGLAADERDSETDAALAALRKAVVEPLALGKGVKRVLLSPDGVLSYVPFAALFDGTGIDLAYEPSGTTYGVLLEDAAKKGVGVLALGDPDYQTTIDERALAVVRGGLRLVPLPGTREEVTAIGTRVLLGAQASEAGFRDAVDERPRWRAVHFACHGLVDPERPAFSSLALTADSEDDGFLTVLEVFRSKIPADLVVLSACETAKGKVVKGEGIMGLTRAFMFAGAPRVICSLWKVDDDATRALMTEFYRLWNPKDGKAGLPTAEALRKAQEFVRSQERWKHPYYWAAWVLWGLPS